MNHKFRGTGIAIVTPFRNGKIDFPALEGLIDFLIDGGVEFIVSLGTTGESVTLSRPEKTEVLEFTADVNKGRVPLVAGFGGNNTKQVVEEIQNFHFSGFDAILSASPAYNKPTQEGIFHHFMELEKVAPVPIIIYNVPGRTSSNISSATTLRLAHASEKFIAIKEASGDLVQCMEIVKDRPKDFLVLSGDDVLTLPMLGFGCDGVISVIGNGFPLLFSGMVRDALSGDFENAKDKHLQLLDLMHLIFVDGNPAGIKGVLEILGKTSREVRLPLVSLTDQTFDLIQEAVKELKAIST